MDTGCSGWGKQGNSVIKSAKSESSSNTTLHQWNETTAIPLITKPKRDSQKWCGQTKVASLCYTSVWRSSSDFTPCTSGFAPALLSAAFWALSHQFLIWWVVGIFFLGSRWEILDEEKLQKADAALAALSSMQGREKTQTSSCGRVK